MCDIGDGGDETPGKRCSSASTCTGNGYTGQCPSGSPQVCTCDKNFVARGETCSLVKPTITRDPSGTIFGEGGDYTLSCETGSADVTGVTFVWKKNGVDTAITKSYTITGASAATHDGNYTCTITYSGVSSTSDALDVTIEAPGKRCTQDTNCLFKEYAGICSLTSPRICDCLSHYKLKGEACVFITPSISRVTAGDVYAEGGDYALICNTDSSINTGMTYVWSKDGNDTTIVSETYTITGVTAAKDGGSYTCTITYNGDSSTSLSFPVTVSAPGKRCTTNTDCTGNGYTGTCTTTTLKFCSCTAHYKLIGESCVFVKPTIIRMTAGSIYGEGGDYILMCDIGSSNTTGVTFLWKNTEFKTISRGGWIAGASNPSRRGNSNLKQKQQIYLHQHKSITIIFMKYN
ncbi:uncharacterized protein LOC131946161 [Physella acuta]|uniref:uncharacterized protein LOC131946161 n=1 Tax=Physella acuta TaxID=109671 RepID=UPI0027DE5DDE|nr:uncharacterized protein LOC131946161 [Physella acuta]